MSNKKKDEPAAPAYQENPNLTGEINLLRQYTAGQIPASTNIRGLESAFLTSAYPQATQLYGQQASLLNNLLSGQRAPGMYGDLGQAISPEIQQEYFNRLLAPELASLEAKGLLDSGARAEVTADTATDVLLGSEMQRRNELASLLTAGLTGASGAIGMPLSLGESFIQQPFGVSQNVLSSLGGREQTQNTLANQQFMAQLQADAQAQQARSQMIQGLFQGAGMAAGAFFGGPAGAMVGSQAGKQVGTMV